MSFEENIKKNNLILPSAADPVGSYVASKIIGKLLYISGQISIDNKGNLIKGKTFKQELLIMPPRIIYIVLVINGTIRSLLSCISNDLISFNLNKTTLVRIGKIV